MDAQHNVRFLTNTSGAVTDQYTYDAFGNLITNTGTTPNNYRFAGEQSDPNLGLYYLRARYWSFDNIGTESSAKEIHHKSVVNDSGGVGVRAAVVAAARALGGGAAGAGHRRPGALVAGVGACCGVAVLVSGSAAGAWWRRGAGRRGLAAGAGLRVGGGVVVGCRGVGRGARRPSFFCA